MMSIRTWLSAMVVAAAASVVLAQVNVAATGGWLLLGELDSSARVWMTMTHHTPAQGGAPRVGQTLHLQRDERVYVDGTLPRDAAWTRPPAERPITDDDETGVTLRAGTSFKVSEVYVEVGINGIRGCWVRYDPSSVQMPK